MLKYLIRKEFKLFLRDPFLPKMAMMYPLMIILVLPLVVTMEVKNVKICIVDNDGTESSRQLVEKINGSGWFIMEGTCPTYEDALKLMEYGEADIILRIPSGFETELLGGRGADALIAANATNSTKSGLGGGYMMSIVTEFASSMQPGNSRTYTGHGLEAGMGNGPSILYLFNNGLNFRVFMLPALMGLIIIVICGVFPALAIVTEKETGTIEQMNVTPVSRGIFIISKLIPYWIIGMAVMSIAFLVAWLAYGFVPAGSYLTIYSATIFMSIAMSALSLIVSNYSATFQQAIYLFFFIMLISILLSGLFTPTESMPYAVRIISDILPPKYYMEIMRGVYLKGCGFSHLWPQFLILGCAGILLSAAAMLSYHKKS